MKFFSSRKMLSRCAMMLILASALIGAGCASGGHHWSYDGATGPANWSKLGMLSQGVGAEQSPIDIPADAPVMKGGLEFNYKTKILNIVNNGHTIQVNFAPGATLKTGGETFMLLQLHFHAGSEHTLAGKQMPMEVHLVHKSAAGGLAVVGVFLTPGADNAAYQTLLGQLPAAKGASVIVGKDFDATTLLPADRSYYRYQGSLTTPPGTEGVKWHVMKNSVAIAEANVKAYTGLYANNFRPVQPMGKREFMK